MPTHPAMYLPAHFEETDTAVLQTLIDLHPLATWVTGPAAVDADPVVDHIPFMLDRNRGPHGTLVGHVARANPVWRQPGRSVLVFQGPHAYISPGWYASKREHGKVVPTWNYAVVHAHGTPRAIEQRDELLAIVTRLTETHEAAQRAPWKVADAPADFVAQMLNAIVGIEIPIDRLVGKWKVSQNRSACDRAGAQQALQASAREDDRAMGELVGGYRPPGNRP